MNFVQRVEFRLCWWEVTKRTTERGKVRGSKRAKRTLLTRPRPSATYQTQQFHRQLGYVYCLSLHLLSSAITPLPLAHALPNHAHRSLDTTVQLSFYAHSCHCERREERIRSCGSCQPPPNKMCCPCAPVSSRLPDHSVATHLQKCLHQHLRSLYYPTIRSRSRSIQCL